MNDSLLGSILTVSPMLAVWLAGMGLSMLRFRRHPEVSVLLTCGLGAMFSVHVGVHVVFYLTLTMPSANDGGILLRAVLAIVALAGFVMESTAWAAVLTAIFGWRQRSVPRPSPFRVRFSLQSLLLVTLAIAVLCGMASAAASFLDVPDVALVSLVEQSPTFLAWLIGTSIALSRWPAHPAVSRAAVIGLGLCCAMIVGAHVVWRWIAEVPNRYRLIGPLAFGFSIVLAVAWVALLRAAIGWRGSNEPFSPTTRMGPTT
jgi:hypothetical protein